MKIGLFVLFVSAVSAFAPTAQRDVSTALQSKLLGE